jgi:hypothetical protein
MISQGYGIVPGAAMAPDGGGVCPKSGSNRDPFNEARRRPGAGSGVAEKDQEQVFEISIFRYRKQEDNERR